MSNAETVWGLVLAGGQSRRMGSDKALLTLDGETQLSRTVRTLERHVPRVFVSARAAQDDDPERSRYPRIVDRREDVGPVAGILAALDSYPDISWLVVACDLPNVDDATIAELLAARDSARPFTAYISSNDGLPEPLCAIYSSSAAAIVERFVNDGLHCPRKILLRSDTQLLEQGNPRALDNVNTPEDLAASVLELAQS